MTCLIVNVHFLMTCLIVNVGKNACTNICNIFYFNITLSFLFIADSQKDTKRKLKKSTLDITNDFRRVLDITGIKLMFVTLVTYILTWRTRKMVN